MDPFSSSHRTYVDSGQRIGVIDGKAYVARNIFVAQSHRNNIPPPPPPSSSSPGRDWNMNGGQQPETTSRSKSKSKTSWLNKRDLKRKKRIFKYKWYAMEGKVKNSFKKGIRWIKRTSNRIVYGF